MKRSIVLTALAFSTAALAQETAPPTLEELAALKRMIPKVKEVVTERFKDPSAAQFRRFFVSSVSRGTRDGSVAYTLCGEVNGKNSYGAYVGYKMFTIVVAGDRAISPMIDGDQLMIATEICRKGRVVEVADQ